jgi:hypothetical protein
MLKKKKILGIGFPSGNLSIRKNILLNSIGENS